MKTNKLLRLIAAVLTVALLAALMTGCGDGEPTSYDNDQAAAERAEQSLWQVLDDAGELDYYLPDDNDDVAQIMAVVSAHHTIVDNRKAGDLRLDNEYALYSEGFRSTLDKSEYTAAVEKMYNDNQMKLTAGGQVWYVNTLSSALTSAKVTVDCEFTIDECAQSYLDEYEVATGVVYVQQRTFYLEKTDRLWQITSITKSAIGQKAEM